MTPTPCRRRYYVVRRPRKDYFGLNRDGAMVAPSTSSRGVEMKNDHPSNPPVLSVPEAGRRYFGVGRSASYEAARRKEIPTIKIGRKLLVPIAAVERMLAEAR